MGLSTSGTLLKKFETVQVSESFKKREFILRIEDEGYTEEVKFQLLQKHCEKLERFKEGDQLTVSFNLKGRAVDKDGERNWYNNLDAWKLE